jgi:alginate O-acetyltransferase complex protein AlgJ
MDTPLQRRSAVQTLLFCGVIAVIAIMAAINARSFHIPAHVALMDGSLAKAFETHYDDVFPVKRLGVNLWAAIDYTLFAEGLPGVVIGRQNWLYTDEEFNVSDDAELNIRTNLALIAAIKKKLAARNVTLVIGVVPTKAGIYREFVAGRRPARTFGHLYDELLTSVRASGIPTVDLRSTLIDGKRRQPTYLRTDTHWTPWGANLAATEIANVARDTGLLHSSGSSMYATRMQAVRVYRGDLFGFLPLEPLFRNLLPPPETLSLMKTEAVASQNAGPHSSASDLFGDGGLPDIALIGTSYSANTRWNFPGYLKEALGEDIANYAREGTGPFRPMLAYLTSEDFRHGPPRLVIWEIPERALVVGAGLTEAATALASR